ncbi:MAG: ArsR family transcriptional regulator [Calditrichaeota bacterium]|nr:MAG: ArsR family transcriptional regulator [Calditrichota bacterium]
MAELTLEVCSRHNVDIEKLQNLHTVLQTENNFDELAGLLAMMGNVTRLRILYLLVHAGELCVCDLADILEMSVSAVSHQLRRLRDRQVITPRREGQVIIYRLADGPIKKVAYDFFKLENTKNA